MHVDGGEPVAPSHAAGDRCVMWWRLCEAAETAFIAVGTLGAGGWFVQHTRHGCRRFRDRAAAWAAVRRLMTHDPAGRWVQVPDPADVRTATHPAAHHPRVVVDAAIAGYRAGYHGQPPPADGGAGCCHQFGLDRGWSAAARDRAAGLGPQPRTAEFADTASVRHPWFHDPVQAIEGVADGYRAGLGGEPPDRLHSPDCCYAFGFWESVRVGEADYIRATAEAIHARDPGTSVEQAERQLWQASYWRRHPYD